MERLTFDGNFCDIAQCSAISCPYDNNCTQKEVWERLKAYEDSRLSPQACAEAREIEETLSGCGYSISRMMELMKADKDGRVVVLPCKVGDTVWITGSVRRLYSEKVRTFFCGDPSYGRGEADNNVQMIRTTGCDIPIHKFNKTVFLTREEAEKAMKGETEK